MICKNCKEELSEVKIRRHAKFCSMKCYRQNKNNQYRKLNPRMSNLTNGTIGAISELRVALDLMVKGKFMFKSVDPGAPIDYVVMDGKEIYSLEVKTGSITTSGKIMHPIVKTKPDRLAIVVGDKIIYKEM